MNDFDEKKQLPMADMDTPTQAAAAADMSFDMAAPINVNSSKKH